MTKRFTYEKVWAENGTATDPDLDTTHPSYEADKYEDHGWKSEKPPEEWQNFLSQISDVKIQEAVISGLILKDTSVTYLSGAIFSDAGKVYVQNGTTPAEVLTIKATELQSFVANLKKLLSDHLAADNPHNDTIGGLVGGGYEKPAVDKAFGDETDPQTINYHKNLRGTVAHSETVTQLGTLPVAGGTFTGDVVFADDAIIQVTPSMQIHLNKSTALFEMANGTVSMGIDANGVGWIVRTTGTYQIMTEANYNRLNREQNVVFALPLPFLSMDIETNINDAASIGEWSIQTAKAPEYLADAGYKVNDNIFTLNDFNVGLDATVYFSGSTVVVDTTDPLVPVYTITPVKLSHDIAAKDYSGQKVSALMTDIGALAASHIKQIKVYSRLTQKQISMLDL